MDGPYKPGDAVNFPITSDTAITACATSVFRRNGADEASPPTVTYSGSGTKWYGSYTIPSGWSPGDRIFPVVSVTAGSTYTVVGHEPVKLVAWGPSSLPASPAGQLNGVPVLVENDGGLVGVNLVMIANTPVTSSAVIAIDFADTVATRANQTTAQTSLDTLTTRVPSTVHTASQQTADHAAELTAIGNVPGLVWASGTRTLTGFGTLAADVAAANWSSLTSGLTTPGSVGKWILDNLTGLASQASLDEVAGQVEAVNSELIDQGTTLDAALAAAQGAQTNTTSVPGLLEDDGAGGKRFKASALSQSPAGSGEGAGDGDVVVDHDTGGADALRVVTPGGVGVDNARLRAYRRTDYAAGNFVVRDAGWTDADGRWVNPMNLNAGTEYALEVSGGVPRISTKVVYFTVPAEG